MFLDALWDTICYLPIPMKLQRHLSPQQQFEGNMKMSIIITLWKLLTKCQTHPFHHEYWLFTFAEKSGFFVRKGKPSNPNGFDTTTASNRATSTRPSSAVLYHGSPSINTCPLFSFRKDKDADITSVWLLRFCFPSVALPGPCDCCSDRGRLALADTGSDLTVLRLFMLSFSVFSCSTVRAAAAAVGLELASSCSDFEARTCDMNLSEELDTGVAPSCTDWKEGRKIANTERSRGHSSSTRVWHISSKWQERTGSSSRCSWQLSAVCSSLHKAQNRILKNHMAITRSRQ